MKAPKPKKATARNPRGKAGAPVVDPKNRFTVRQEDFPGQSLERIEARIAQSPVFSSAATGRLYSRGTYGDSDLTQLVSILDEKVSKVKSGDLSDMEAILVSQAVALDAIFTELARRCALNMGTYLEASETYMRLALKAQSQARSTIETLAEIKNPRPVAFVKQANIANGPQQVNNGIPGPDQSSRARETENLPNKLLEAQDGERLDAGTKGAAGGVNKGVAAVG